MDNYEIKVIIDEGGIFQGLYVSPALADADVELLDFVTDDPNELDDVTERYEEAKKRCDDGELELITY